MKRTRQVCGLDYPFTVPRKIRGLGAARLVSTPSRLEFSDRAWLGIAMSQVSPNLGSSASPVSRRALKLAQVRCVCRFRHARMASGNNRRQSYGCQGESAEGSVSGGFVILKSQLRVRWCFRQTESVRCVFWSIALRKDGSILCAPGREHAVPRSPVARIISDRGAEFMGQFRGRRRGPASGAQAASPWGVSAA